MKKFIFLLAFVFSLVLTGCKKAGTQVQTDGEKHDFDVQFLFETDGVKVYRFFDLGEYIYFTNANGKTSYVTGSKVSERRRVL
jgi:hypothetical protein|nr:MAG TPA: protein of unknown function (DUF4884) [Caudoviricetes sp.]